ncbi:MAG: cytochrome b/b6 domain-containing protein [Mariprofundaceae bacterium]|nr:cytochrome b/b6 domain-containing protein [Mariprofundaceae bacterium]
MKYARITRLIHLFLAVFITLQLTGGELMDVPGSGKDHRATSLITPALAHEGTNQTTVAGSFLFEIHEYIGLFLVLIVLTRWVWGFMCRGNANWHTMFLWLTAQGRKELADDLRREPLSWLKGKLPEPTERDAIAKTMHGIMILTATGMVLTGLALYFGWNEQGNQTALVDGVGEIHETLSGILWTLLGGHVFMALWHQMSGHNVLGKMFSLKP